jgi:hypothetical protein
MLWLIRIHRIHIFELDIAGRYQLLRVPRHVSYYVRQTAGICMRILSLMYLEIKIFRLRLDIREIKVSLQLY